MRTRRALTAALALMLALSLGGCRKREPVDKAALGWDESWTAVGDILAAEPVEGFDFNESQDALSVYGIYYATWSCGEGEDFTNSEGKDAKIYDAEIYLLIQECKSEKQSESMLDEWETRERSNYECGETGSTSQAGQDYRLIRMISGHDDNPYTGGAAAVGARGDRAICVELLCREGFAGDPEETVKTFLAGLHFNDGEGD